MIPKSPHGNQTTPDEAGIDVPDHRSRDVAFDHPSDGDDDGPLAPGGPRDLPDDDLSFDLTEAEFRRVGERVVALMAETVAAERAEPVLRRPGGAELRALLDGPLPREGVGLETMLEAFRERVLPYARRNGHPRFFGYVCTSADPFGMFADALASALNQPVTAWRSTPAATAVERLTVRWLDELTGFNARESGGGGLLVSGGSSANFHATVCAAVRAESRAGLPPGSRHRLAIYVSTETHISLRKAAQLVGIPPAQARVIDVDSKRRLRIDVLRDAIARDRDAGLVPALVCASAGTVNAGTIDPLEEVADVCAEHGVWYHIDGSYGAPAVLTPEYTWLRHAFARADSLSLDPHKWLFAPVDAGCILVRDEAAMRAAFTLHSEYIAVAETDPIERYALFDHGLELSRRFRGLKVWMMLAARGADRIGRVIAHDIALRHHLDARIAADPRLESLGSELSIACFRFAPAGVDGSALDALNRAILERIVAEGRCYMSPTVLDGRYALRVCIVSFRTRRSDVDLLLDEVLRIGGELSASE